MNKIITIGREFGSGGRELGRRLSEELGVAYYDEEIVAAIAERTQMSEEYVKQIIEHRPLTSYPIHIGRSFYPNMHPVMEQTNTIFQAQSAILREMAEKSDCVIVGLCGDYILRDNDPFRFFVYADMDSKIKRCRAKGAEHENMSDEELKRHITAVERHRAKYYDYFTGQKWGNRAYYDLCVNTTNTNIKEVSHAFAKLF